MGEDSVVKEANSIRIGEKHKIGASERCFIVAEIGQNHQGNFDLAKEMIKVAKECGADCVKFQKSHLPSKFNKEALLRPYDSVNSWGGTYGEHKAYLEFSEREFVQLQEYASELDILFTASAMDAESLKFLNSLNVPFIKIGSGDFHNKPLLQEAARLCKPLIISSGMSDMKQVVDVYNLIKTVHTEFSLLHCVSSYPAPLCEINLNVLKAYGDLFPDIPIGYSGHELGIQVAVAAVALGAKVIEKHFTLNKEWKGSDHICSLTPDEFKKMVSEIRLYEASAGNLDILQQESVQVALGVSEKKFQESERACYEKLGKTIVAARDLGKGEVIIPENIWIKVAEPKGIPASKFDWITGKRLRRNIKEDESIFECDVL